MSGETPLYADEHKEKLMKKHMRSIWLSMFVVLAVLVTACGGTTSPTAHSSTTNTAPKTVTITVTEFKIASDLTHFSLGIPYHFVVVNKGATLHELMIAPPLTGTMTVDDLDKLRLFEVSDIAAGETKTLDYTFKESAPLGKLEMACHVPGHYEAGMKLPVVIV